MDHVFEVLNLDRQPERWQSFLSNNPEFTAAQRLVAVEGRAVDRDALVAQGIITPDNGYNPGALGCMMSHVGFWRRVAESGAAATIMEDDAILHPQFAQAVEAGMRIGGWDILVWGWNMDWPMLATPAPGLQPMLMSAFTSGPKQDSALFKKSHFNTNLMRLYSAAGTLCYSLSPSGAEKLLRLCLPFGTEAAPYYAAMEKKWANSGLDVELSRHYAEIESYCCFPPKAFSLNDWHSSSIRPNDTNSGTTGV